MSEEHGNDVRAENAEKPQAEKPPNEKSQPEPRKDDWVTKRFLCSLPNVFKDLTLQVEEDVKTRNALRPNNSPYEFVATAKGEDFIVVLETEEVRKAVVFSREPHAIVVRDDDGKTMFEVTLTFSDQGECKLHVNQEERDMWQVRRMALEGLLFQGY